MALTITQQPQAYTPAYNNQFIVALSDQNSATGFSYRVEVSINGDVPLVYDILPRPDGYMVFDVMESVKNYISNSFDPTQTSPVEDVDHAVEVEVTIIENNISPFDTETVSYIAWNACLKELDFRDFVYTDYVSNGSVVKLLSPVNDEYANPDDRVTLDTDLWVHFFRNNANSVEFTVLDENNATVDSFSLSIPTDNNLIYYVNIGPQTVINNSVAIQDGYTVLVSITAPGSPSTIVEYSTSYVVSELCTRHVPYIVYYLKRNGNIGQFHFELKSEETENKKTSEVKLNGSTLVAGIYNKPVYVRERHTVNTETNKSIVLNTDWITESQSTKLNELFDSPIVWIKTPEGDYLPVNVTDTSYKYNKNTNDKLFNYTIVCEYGTTETRQRGL